jgi:hypothetical protein
MTAKQLAAKFRAREVAVEREFRKTSNGLAISAVKFCKERLTAEVYAIPEDLTKSGKKKWRRTGQLRRAERAEVRDPFTVVVVNDVGYALPRHEAGKPGRRKINPNRESHWRDELAKVFEEITTDAYRLTVAAILKTGGKNA